MLLGLVLAVVVIAIGWDIALRERHGKALVFGALALVAGVVGGLLQALDLSPWSLCALLAALSLGAVSQAANTERQPEL